MNEKPATESLLIIFAKSPVVGKVKKRLIPFLGEAGACDAYKKMLLHTRHVCDRVISDRVVFYTDDRQIFNIWPDDLYQKQAQQGDDIGMRMLSTFEYAFRMGYQKAVLFGGDIIEINPNILQTAFATLDRNEVVIGPASDGGYYLIGMNRLLPGLFYDIDWSTDRVFRQNVEKIEKMALSYAVLERLSDIDDYDDYLRFKHLLDKINLTEQKEVFK
ncbi:MAG: TIGR04282 family arsenosugar biosynthesis glycosyltransferase [Bacteroidales bacterium]|nr:TIGR04282 family arsenosugar biosynthesis glycosyltransferase [Bacteroidales bacterium]MCF8350881.1 TIGR04282 family arsenosugar biosynthesis glycosyltransferase [Bacteroidales bacterium]MCF8375637.1 TIGR04282 family arsenosugar biosynthesis glycosyltransferase [Bacteroidales bacterium]MCF8400780.1 TIGR04282 family arsenosugar biosynthesis glycosyltransferase [Bacteroidales bacterium]